MHKCETCQNSYDRCLQIIAADGSSHYFDSFECAIHALAPICAGCGCRVLGHGLDVEGSLFCCNHCARVELDNAIGSDRVVDLLG